MTASPQHSHTVPRPSLSARWRSGRVARRPFYRICDVAGRRHPAWENCTLRMIDGRTVISHARHYLFVRVPKCANTTILSTLGLLERGIDPDTLAALGPEERKDLLRKQQMKLVFARPSELNARAAAEVLQQYRKCIFVRNPFTRLASGYLHKVRAGGYAARAGLSADISFAGFCDHLADGGLYSDIHWFPQSSICPLPAEELDFIGRFENLDRDLHALTQLVHGTSAEAVTAKHRPTHAARHVHELYTEREIDLVGELYADDFHNFGYAADRLPD